MLSRASRGLLGEHPEGSLNDSPLTAMLVPPVTKRTAGLATGFGGAAGVTATEADDAGAAGAGILLSM